MAFIVSNWADFRLHYLKEGGGATGYFSKKILDDSAFPFTSQDELVIRIEEERLIIERKDEVSKGDHN